MNSMQILLYGFLKSNKGLRTVLQDYWQNYFNKLLKFPNIIEILLLRDQAQEQEIRCLLTIFIHKNYFKKGKDGVS